MKKILLVVLLVIGAVGCKTTDTGTVNVVVNKGAIETIQKPEDGFYTTMSFWTDSYEVDLRTVTEETKDVKVQTKDNTPIKLGTLQITFHTSGDPEAVKEYVTKFGFDPKVRHPKRIKILDSQLQTEARKSFSQYDAYQVYANQEKIQQDLFERMKKIGAEELFLVVESVQFGNWGFENDAIENAASAVVANRKQKEAEEAALAAAQIRQQKSAIEAQVLKDPQLFAIERLKYQLWIEQARAEGMKSHSGNLTVIYGADKPLMNMPVRQE